MKRVVPALVLMLWIWLFQAIAGFRLPVAIAQPEYEKLAMQLTNQQLTVQDLNRFFIIEKNKLDLNQDGQKEDLYFVAVPMEYNHQKFFWQPGYLIYTDQGKLKKHKLDFPGLDLNRENIKVRYGDISGDGVPEIFYSVDYPMPEHVERWPHLLQYNRKQGKFIDTEIAKKYNYLIADWGIDWLNQGPYALWLDLKKNIYDDRPVRTYFRLVNGKLIKVDKPLRVIAGGLELKADRLPFNEKGRIFISIRSLFNLLYAWPRTQNKDKFTVSTLEHDWLFDLKQKQIYRDRNQIGTQLKIKAGEGYIPIRLAAEILQGRLFWDQQTNTVYLTDYQTVKKELEGEEYYLKAVNGDLLLKAGGRAVKILSVGKSLDFPKLTLLKTPQGNTLVNIHEVTGEPHVHHYLYTFYIKDQKVVYQTTAYYMGRWEENWKLYQESVVMTDGKKVVLINDRMGEVSQTYNLVDFTGVSDDYFLEALGKDYLLVRPNGAGLLTLIKLKDRKSILLYKELLSPMEQEQIEKASPREDHLELIKEENGTLYFRNNTDSELFEYTP